MTITTTTLPATTAILACLLAMPTQAQDVCLSEVSATAGEQWVELHNRSQQSYDLSLYTLHYCTQTPGEPQNYWWPFPAGTSIPAGAFLRVHWFQDEPSAVLPGNLYTGTSPWDFLFGLGGEELQAGAGAFALLSSQANEEMNSSAIFVDWVSWGANGFDREYLAAEAGLWDETRHLPAMLPDSSLARDADLVGSVTYPDEAWFVDFTPTPGMPNVTGAIAQSYGDPCTLPGHHLLGMPELRATSLPLVGNAQFALSVDNTTGIYGEFVLIGFSVAAAPAGLPSILPPFAGSSCHESIDVFQLITTWLMPATILGTNIPMPLDAYGNSLIGTEVHAQALVLELLPNAYPPYQGLTNALRLVVGQ